MKGGLMLCKRVRNSVNCQWNCLRAAFNVVVGKSWEGQKQIIKVYIDGPKFIFAWINKEIPCWIKGDVVGEKCNVTNDVMMLGSEQLGIPMRAAYEYICQVHYWFGDFGQKEEQGAPPNVTWREARAMGLSWSPVVIMMLWKVELADQWTWW